MNYSKREYVHLLRNGLMRECLLGLALRVSFSLTVHLRDTATEAQCINPEACMH